MNHITYNFLASMLEIFSACCLFDCLSEDYEKGKSWRKLMIACILATVITLMDYFKINANIGGTIFLLWMSMALFYSVKLIRAFFDAICVGIVYSVLQMLILFLFSLISDSLLTNKTFLIFMLIGVAVLFFAGTHSSRLLECLRFFYQRYQEETRWILINLLLIQIIYMYNWNENGYQFGPDKELIVAFMAILLLTNFCLMQMVVKTKRQKAEIEKRRELDQMKEEFLEQMAEKQHEFSKHLDVLKHLALKASSESAIAEMRVYLDGLIFGKSEEDHHGYTGNGLISAFLAEREIGAKRKGIQFSHFIMEPLPEYPCQPHELIEVVGNLVNNAFDAVEHLPASLKKVYLELGRRSELMFIQTINSIPENFSLSQEQMLEKGFSTKSGEYRGYGLSNIKAIVQKYSGKISIEKNDEVIKIEILF